VKELSNFYMEKARSSAVSQPRRAARLRASRPLRLGFRRLRAWIPGSFFDRARPLLSEAHVVAPRHVRPPPRGLLPALGHSTARAMWQKHGTHRPKLPGVSNKVSIERESNTLCRRWFPVVPAGRAKLYCRMKPAPRSPAERR